MLGKSRKKEKNQLFQLFTSTSWKPPKKLVLFHFKIPGEVVPVSPPLTLRKITITAGIQSSQWSCEWHVMDDMWGQLHGAIRVRQKIRRWATNAAAVSDPARNKLNYFHTFPPEKICLMTSVEPVSCSPATCGITVYADIYCGDASAPHNYNQCQFSLMQTELCHMFYTTE